MAGFVPAVSIVKDRPCHSGAPQANPEPITTASQEGAISVAALSAALAFMGPGFRFAAPG